MAQSTDAGPLQPESWHGPSLSFALDQSSSVPKFGPRVGRITLVRGSLDTPSSSTTTTRSAAAIDSEIVVDTPNILVGTSRGVVPHLSRDHTNGSDAIQWINVSFESFLEQAPPVPTLQDGPQPLHTFLGFNKVRHIASLCLRDPLDTREMPPNGNTYVSANCIRGVKKVTLSDWRTYVYKMRPDVVFALTDTPYTPLPYSQKRITKSIERSAAWLADLLRPLPATSDQPPLPASRLSSHPLQVFVQMAGGTSISAREAFAYTLRETLHGAEADVVKPLRSLDEGVAGYAFDLAVLRGLRPSPNAPQHQSLPGGLLKLEERPLDLLQHPEPIAEAPTPTPPQDASGGVNPRASRILSMATSELTPPPDVVSLLKASLGELPQHKPRLVTGVRSPHEMLRLVCDVGVELFDVGWAMHFAHLGVALDFIFPAPPPLASDDGAGEEGARRRRLGHNLYNPVYARQFVCLADTLGGAGESERADGIITAARQVCMCIACSPRSPSAHILHSTVDRDSYATTIAGEQEFVRYEKPFTRAYIHHLLQTHEMSAHTLLVAHNLSVVSVFLAGVRKVCGEHGGSNLFALEVERFNDAYDESGELFLDARKDWEHVDKARGKGRLAREREKQRNDQDS